MSEKQKQLLVKIKKLLKELEDEINSAEAIQETNDEEDGGGGNNPDPPDIP